MKFFLNYFFLISLSFFTPSSAFAMIINPFILSDNMVLQAETENYLWGYAEPGDTVVISFKDIKIEAQADQQSGIWKAKLPPMPPDNQASTMKISDSNSNQVIENVRIGDVWIFSINNYLSGNINIPEMAEIEKARKEARENIGQAEEEQRQEIKIPAELEQKYAIDNVFFFNVALKSSPKIEFTISSVWRKITVEEIHNKMPQALYYFARLHSENRKTALGIINISWPDSSIEAWISEKTLKKSNELSNLLSAWANLQKNFPAAEKKWKENVEKWNALNNKYNEDFEKYRKAKAFARIKDLKKTPYPKKPDGGPNSPNMPSGLYNGMLSTIAPYSARALVFMPSEKDVLHANIYAELLEAMLSDISELWNSKPPQVILFYSPASWKKDSTALNPRDELPIIREKQKKIADEKNIPILPSSFPGHNQRKKLAERIFLCAEAVYSGKDIRESLQIPFPEEVKTENGKIIITIRNSAGKVYSLSSIRLDGDQSAIVGKNIEIEYKKSKYGNMNPTAKIKTDSPLKVINCEVAEIYELNEEYEMVNKTVSYLEMINEKSAAGFSLLDGKTKQLKVAETTIEDDRIILFNESVQNPLAVFHAFSDSLDSNLVNGLNIPLPPFRIKIPKEKNGTE